MTRPSEIQQISRGSFTSMPAGFELVPNLLATSVKKIISVPFQSKIKEITFCDK